MTSMQTFCTSPTTLDLDNRVFEHNAVEDDAVVITAIFHTSRNPVDLER